MATCFSSCITAPCKCLCGRLSLIHISTFLNERQKAAVRVEKQDEETKNPLSGGIYGLYAAEDIKVDGKTVVPKGTLIEKATTGADGKASYKAELPINYSYSIREIQAPEL